MTHRTRIAPLLPLLALGWGVAAVPFLVKSSLLAQASGGQFGTKATPNVMVSARDGMHLATDVYVPTRDGTISGRFPTIVERTPYNKDAAADAVVKYFVPRGYKR